MTSKSTSLALKPAYDAIQMARRSDFESVSEASRHFEDGLRLLLKHFKVQALGPDHLAKVGLNRDAVLDYRQHVALDKLGLALGAGSHLAETAGPDWKTTAQAPAIRAHIKAARACLETLKMEDGLSRQVVFAVGADPEKVKLFWDAPLTNIPIQQPDIHKGGPISHI